MPGRSRSQLRKQAKMQQDWVDPDWRIYEDCFSCNSRFVVNNYPDRKPRRGKHMFQGVPICPWCWRRGGRKLAQAAYLLKKFVEATPEGLWFDEDMIRIGKIADRADQVVQSWG